MKRGFSTSEASPFVTTKIGVERRPRAIVLVLGFGGAKPRHIAKYAQLYNIKGCNTISGTASNHDIFVDHSGIDVFAKNALSEVVKMVREDEANSSDKDTPIVMHIISNGGAFVTRSINTMLDTREQHQQRADLELFATRLRLGYQVFDSAPCYPEAKSSFNVITHLIPNPFIGIPAAVL